MTTKVPYISKENKSWETNTLPEMEISKTIFLIGDTGRYYEDKTPNPVFSFLEKDINQTDNSSLVFLGDNIYSRGLPEEGHEERKKSEATIKKQLELLKNYKGDTYFIPGNHDWNKMSEGGLKYIKRQENYINEYYSNRDNIYFFPENGCGDPVKIKEENKLIYIFIDSQWWLQNWEKEDRINKHCDVKSRQGFLDEFDEMVKKNKNKQIIVFMHHPLYANGNHGGSYSFKQHLFPLTEINKKAYLPLPVIGSLYPSYRSLTGSKQDIVNVHYQELKSALLSSSSLGKNIIFAAGHEHGLQYTKKGDHHFVVSGAGSKTSFMARGKGADFVVSQKGYSKLYYYQNKEVWLEFITVVDGEARVRFRKQIVPPPAGSDIEETIYPEVTQDSIRVAANKNYKGGFVKKVFLGKQYRDLWTAEVNAKVINLDTELGGLTPIKKGGGMASNSLRLETKDGKQYVLRSIDKDLSKALPEDMRNIKLATSILKDQTSAIHPYGALLVTPLAEAANVYHNNPQLVYLPHQNGLLAYNDLFEEGLYYLEERPTGDRSDLDNLGNSKNIIGYIDLLSKLRKSPKHRIDQEWALKSRLFDILIHDWDRHDDQWRWASFKEGEHTIYKPIPRDRDEAFYQFKGLLPSLIAFLPVRQFKTFKHDLKDVKWQSFNGKYFDRHYLNEMDESDWLAAAKELQKNLTDEKIEAAAQVWPREIREKNAKITISKLKSRRDKLDKYALKLYRYISKEVNVIGTDKKELFIVNHLENGDVRVEMYVTNKNKDKKELIYNRLFDKKVTKEIRLYGLGGKDHFVVESEGKKRIKIRIIGGEGKDDLDDLTTKGKKTYVYDAKGNGLELNNVRKIKDKRSNDVDVNKFGRKAFKYNTAMPSVILSSSVDDGFWFGGGATFTKHGFRKSPYKSKQSFSVSLAPSSRGTFDVNYSGDFIEAVGKLDFHLNASMQNPTNFNFYGLGNENEIEDVGNRFYSVRMKNYILTPTLKKRFGSNLNVKFGPYYESIQLVNVEGRVLDNPTIYGEDVFEINHFLGPLLSFSGGRVDKPAYPKEGTKFNIDVLQQFGLNNQKESYGKIQSSTSFYLTLGTNVEFTIANRLGGAHVWGSPLFYQHLRIGNNNYLRGFRNERFQGNSIFYNNLDLRLKLVHWNNVVMPMDIGVMGGFDVARVWYKGEVSNQYHKSYTAGIWLSPVSLFVINPHMSFSDEGRLFTFRLGFNF